MDSCFARWFFFEQTYQAKEDRKAAIISRLYLSVKANKLKDPTLSESLKKVGKETLAFDLCRELNISIMQLHEMDYNFVWQHIYAMHVQKASRLKKIQEDNSSN